MNDSNRGAEESRVAVLQLRPIRKVRAVLLGLAYWALLIPLSYAPRHSGNVWSRYMTVESLVERGSLAIEASPLLPISGSPDVVKLGRHLYSDKPPVLSVLTAGLYKLLTWAGLRFSHSPQQFVQVNLVLVSAVVGSASALSLIALRLMLQTVPISRFLGDLLTLGCGLGTLLLSYGVTFNNHSVAAGLLTCAIAGVLLEDPLRPISPARRVILGLLSGLGVVIDLPAGGAVTFSLAVWMGLRDRRIPGWFAGGVLVPLLGHSALQWSVTGSPLPVELTPAVFEYEGSYWKTAEGEYREIIPRWQWGLEFVLGPQGWLTVTPVFALGLVGLGRVVLNRSDPLRPLALVTIGIMVMLFGFYIAGVRRIDFAGLSYGTRHLVAMAPLSYFFAVVWLSRSGRWAWLLFVVLWCVGAIYAWGGMIDPWTRLERRPDLTLRVLQKGVLYPWSSYQR